MSTGVDIPSSGAGTRRSLDTKAAILVAARPRFSVDGYQATTIRAVARDAGIDPALVMRYFGSKAELFARATDIDLRVPDLTDSPGARTVNDSSSISSHDGTVGIPRVRCS